MITARNGLPFQLTVLDDPAHSELAHSGAPLARFKAVTGFPHSRTTTVLLGEPVNATRQAMADGSTVSKLAWTLEQLVGVHSHKLRQPVERVKVRFDAEEGDYAGRGAEVLVDPSQTCPRIELIFDRMLDTPDARGWVVSVLNAAACMLAGGHQSQLQQQPVAHTEGLGDEREPGTAAEAAA